MKELYDECDRPEAQHVWGFGPEDNYEVGDTFIWDSDYGDVHYCGSETAKPFGTYRITRKSVDQYGRNWYQAELLPDNPMTEEDMKDIST